MALSVNINIELAPKEWSKFKRWHKLACKNDPMSAEDRFKAIGGELPQKKAQTERG